MRSWVGIEVGTVIKNVSCVVILCGNECETCVLPILFMGWKTGCCHLNPSEFLRDRKKNPESAKVVLQHSGDRSTWFALTPLSLHHQKTKVPAQSHDE